MHAFYEPDADTFVATPLTRGPWDDRHQHGGPPAALLAGAMARFGDAEAYEVARVWVELLRPVPIARLRPEVAIERGGRTAQRLVARLFDGDTLVMEARALRLRRVDLDLPIEPPDRWPDPEGVPPYSFTFFRCEVGYHQAIELRLVHGAWGGTPIGFWGRPRVPLVAGRTTTPLECLVVLADAQSGMGVPLDPLHFSFVNPDMSLHLARPPQGAWFGFDIRSRADGTGLGLAESAVRDVFGVVGRSAQSLVVRPR